MAYYKLYHLKKYPVILNIPHSSTYIPKKFSKDFLVDKTVLQQETFELADLYTKELFKPLIKNFGGIVSEISRLIVDIERFEDDNLEYMSRVGMGVLYEKSTSGIIIRSLDEMQKKQLLELLYYPYHQNFEKMVNDSLAKFHTCIILDCHSFPSEPRPYELNQEQNRPDICLGIDSFHTPKKLLQIFKQNLDTTDFTFKENNPFSGTLVPMKHYRTNKKVCSIMIEVNRNLYMDQNNFSKKIQFNDISLTLCSLINKSIFEFLA